MAADLGMAVTVWGALASGLLSDKYAVADRRPEGEVRLTNKHFIMRDVPEKTGAVLPVLTAIAAEIGRGPTEVALAWVRSRSPIMLPIIGARTLAQLETNLGCLDLTLDDDQIARLDAASAIPMGYPFDLLRSSLHTIQFAGQRDKLDAKSRSVL
jgi:aryl-alcohol dehydrogenase-like predicted oxidoreductase